MIRSFGDKRTAALFEDQVVRDFQRIARRAKRKLEAVNSASKISDLAVPPSNRLEKLREDFEGFYSVRINDQWRVIFRWSGGERRRGPNRGLPLTAAMDDIVRRDERRRVCPGHSR